jgi:hypothetical protein
MRIALAIALIALVQPLQAWFDGGHMVVAYIAYKNLTPETRSHVDALLRLNPKYDTWTAGVPDKERGLIAFLHAATWADCIKSQSCAPGYTNDGDEPPGNPSDAQNIGYDDKLMHRYWHYVDLPIAAGAPGEAAKAPNALTQIVLLSAAIHSDEPRGTKSYDVVWLEHLVGDVHQPLHCVSRFTRNHPHGDAGGNGIRFCERPCRDELHFFWDGLLGDKPAIDEVAKLGDELMAASRPAGADDLTPSDWIDAGFALAKSNVYIPPISADNDPGQPLSPRPDPAYAAAALKVARSQVTLAGYRLAALLNTNLKP